MPIWLSPCFVGKFEEAEVQARQALRLDPNHAKAHYLLALCLIRQHKPGKEALEHANRWRSSKRTRPRSSGIGVQLPALR